MNLLFCIDGEEMKEIFKMGLGLYGKLIVINIMCFFLAISMSVLATAVFTEDIGYTALIYNAETEELVTQYDYYYADGDDTKLAEYETDEYIVNKSTKKSELTKGENTAFYFITQLFCMIMLIMFIYPNLWDRGTRDNNLVSFGHAAEDKLKGLKVGLIAIIPAVIFFIFLFVTKSNLMAKLPVGILRLIFSSTYSLNYLICGNTMTVGELSYIQLIFMMLLNLLVPAIAFASYILGYKNISIGEKLVYKKNKK